MRTFTLTAIPLVAVVAWLMVWAYWPVPVTGEWWGDGGMNRPRTLWVSDSSYDIGESTVMRPRFGTVDDTVLMRDAATELRRRGWDQDIFVGDPPSLTLSLGKPSQRWQVYGTQTGTTNPQEAWEYGADGRWKRRLTKEAK